MKVLLFVFSL
jgi:hypothetical protein